MSLSRGKDTWYIPGSKREGEIEKLDFFPYSRKAESSLVDHLIFDDLLAKNLIE